MKPIYENIQPNIGSSFYAYYEPAGCCEPFWHMHPEYELVYINSGSAEMHIGRNVFKYGNGDLLLIGSNVPHSNLGNQNSNDSFEIVVQMSTEMVTKRIHAFPEFSNISKLFHKSAHGISFGEPLKTQVGFLLTQLVDSEPFYKLLILFEILEKLALTKDYTLLNVDAAEIEVQSNDFERLNKVNKYIALHYKNTISLSEMAQLTGLTETSFSRFFKNVTGKTFIGFLNEYRIQKACTLLSNKNTSISEVMEKAGFVEPAHFSRIFKRYTEFTPREYRKKIRSWT